METTLEEEPSLGLFWVTASAVRLVDKIPTDCTASGLSAVTQTQNT